MLLKAEVAELLLPTVIVNLAGRKDLDADLHKTISSQVEFLSCFGWLPMCIITIKLKSNNSLMCESAISFALLLTQSCF